MANTSFKIPKPQLVLRHPETKEEFSSEKEYIAAMKKRHEQSQINAAREVKAGALVAILTEAGHAGKTAEKIAKDILDNEPKVMLILGGGKPRTSLAVKKTTTSPKTGEASKAAAVPAVKPTAKEATKADVTGGEPKRSRGRPRLTPTPATTPIAAPVKRGRGRPALTPAKKASATLPPETGGPVVSEAPAAQHEASPPAPPAPPAPPSAITPPPPPPPVFAFPTSEGVLPTAVSPFGAS